MITTGTEKQIAWASEVKAARLAAWAEFGSKMAPTDPRVAILNKLIAAAEEITDASAWIDNRADAAALFASVGLDRKALCARFSIDERPTRNVLNSIGTYQGNRDADHLAILAARRDAQ